MTGYSSWTAPTAARLPTVPRMLAAILWEPAPPSKEGNGPGWTLRRPIPPSTPGGATNSSAKRMRPWSSLTTCCGDCRPARPIETATGRITIDELYDYVYEHVLNETPKQTPGKWSYRQQGDFVIAKNRKSTATPGDLPVEVLALLDSPLARLRAEALPELAQLLASEKPKVAAAHSARCNGFSTTKAVRSRPLRRTSSSDKRRCRVRDRGIRRLSPI